MCNNLKQLSIAWIMYAGDNNGALPINARYQDQPTSFTDTTSQWALQWCPGNESVPAVGNTGNTPSCDLRFIQMGVIYNYVKSVGIYKCPADNTTVASPLGPQPKTRSMSLNGWLNPSQPYNGSGRVSKRTAPRCHGAPMSFNLSMKIRISSMTGILSTRLARPRGMISRVHIMRVPVVFPFVMDTPKLRNGRIPLSSPQNPPLW